MKTPKQLSNKQSKEEQDNKEEALLLAPDYYGNKSFYPNALGDERGLKKFIKKTEAIVRRSPELKDYIQYLKDEHDLDHCFFFRNLDKSSVSIELHHYPLSLYDIVEIVTKNALANNKVLSTFAIADTVIRHHYENIIGLVPLSKTTHDLAHAGLVYIPLQAVFGDVNTFLELYSKDMKLETLLALKTILTAHPDNITKINSILEERVISNRVESDSIYALKYGLPSETVIDIEEHKELTSNNDDIDEIPF